MVRQLPSLLLLLQVIIATITLLRSLAAVDAFAPFVARNIRFSAFNNKMALSSSSALSATITQQSQQIGNTSFASFLESSVPASLADAAQSKTANKRVNSVIIGNEAGDADSIISALTLGYVTSSNFKSPSDNTFQVPIVSIPRAEMELRRDAALLLDMVGINVEKLIYIDDDVVTKHLLPSSSSGASTDLDTTITLVDHNRLRPMYSHLNSMVKEIVDHHKDENHHEQVDSVNRIIAFENGHATVASTCSLVAERLFQSMSDSDSSLKIDGALGLSLLGVILLDSINMLPEAKKGTPRDEEAIQQLLSRTDWSSCADTVPSLMDGATLDRIFPNGRCNTPDRKALFDALIGAKSDPKFWLEMSAMNCLRIDYKKFVVDDKSSIGLSSVIITMDDLLTKDGFIDSMKSFIASEDVNLFGVLGVTFFDDKPKRELLLAGNDDNVVDSFAQFLLDHPDASDLDMAEREDCNDYSQDGMKIRVFRQGNPKGSRKQIAPLLLQHASTNESKL